MTANSDTSYHEMFRKHQNIKLFFDLDYVGADANVFVHDFKISLCNAINDLYGDLLKDKFVTIHDLFEIIGDGNGKCSRHIIVNPSGLYCNNIETIKMIAERTRELMKSEYQSSVDV